MKTGDLLLRPLGNLTDSPDSNQVTRAAEKIILLTLTSNALPSIPAGANIGSDAPTTAAAKGTKCCEKGQEDISQDRQALGWPNPSEEKHSHSKDVGVRRGSKGNSN